ncbi:hypothetical protein ACFV23_05980 [Streptomyces sp. NPDC059627]
MQEGQRAVGGSLPAGGGTRPKRTGEWTGERGVRRLSVELTGAAVVLRPGSCAGGER